jgi:hypothetical protein
MCGITGLSKLQKIRHTTLIVELDILLVRIKNENLTLKMFRCGDETPARMIDLHDTPSLIKGKHPKNSGAKRLRPRPCGGSEGRSQAS